MGNMTITLPDQMQEALRQASKAEDRVIASIIRRAISEYLLKHHNLEVEHNMTWGGNRRGEKDEN